MESIGKGIAEGRVVVRRFLSNKWSIGPDDAQKRIDKWLEGHPDPNDPPTDRSYDNDNFTADDVRQYHLRTKDRFRPKVTLHTSKTHRSEEGIEYDF
jgi:hypothetical protein